MRRSSLDQRPEAELWQALIWICRKAAGSYHLGKDQSGEDEVWVHAGTVRAIGSDCFLDREGGRRIVRLLPEWLACVGVSTRVLKKLFSAPSLRLAQRGANP
jgi:hypothetical protein